MDRDSKLPAARLGTDQVKASVIRGYTIVLPEMRALDQVCARLPQETRALLIDPPASTAWIPGIAMQHLADAIADARDIAAVRECARRATEASAGVIARGVLEGVLRVFGASPAALYSRYSMMSSNFIKGIEFAYEAESDTEGVMVMRIPSRPVSRPSFCATAGSFEFILGLCKRHGMVSDPELIPHPTGGAARYRIRWTR